MRKLFKQKQGLLGMDDEAQVSAELLIVIAALVAVALVLITQLQNTAEKGKKVLGNATDKAFDRIADIK
ncbi:MAG TPA: hypothetical protein VI875_00715 [Candidatus Norongarragalinales archaeon]|nr:hypothetical protein [Candidatus Norongarragalinales archaeon]